MPIMHEGQYCPNCQKRELATICLECDKRFNKKSLLPLVKMIRNRYGIALKDAKSLAETIDLLVLGYERVNKW